MPSSKHTPGPWEISPNPLGDATRRFIWPEDTENGPVGPCSDTGRCIAIINPRGDVATLEANARLIAAAPDLLAALQKILTAPASQFANPQQFIMWAELVSREAIAKVQS